MFSYSEGTLPPPCLLYELPSTFKIFIGAPLAGTGDAAASIDRDQSFIIISLANWYSENQHQSELISSEFIINSKKLCSLSN